MGIQNAPVRQNGRKGRIAILNASVRLVIVVGSCLTNNIANDSSGGFGIKFEATLRPHQYLSSVSGRVDLLPRR